MATRHASHDCMVFTVADGTRVIRLVVPSALRWRQYCHDWEWIGGYVGYERNGNRGMY